MSDYIDDAVDWWIAQARSVPGISRSGELDEHAGSTGVIFFAYMQAGVLLTESAGQGRDLYTVQGLLIAPRADLKSAMSRMSGLPVKVANLVRVDPTFGKTVQTYDQIQIQIAPQIQWQGVESVGYTITITGVKIRPALS